MTRRTVILALVATAAMAVSPHLAPSADRDRPARRPTPPARRCSRSSPSDIKWVRNAAGTQERAVPLRRPARKAEPYVARLI